MKLISDICNRWMMVNLSRHFDYQHDDRPKRWMRNPAQTAAYLVEAFKCKDEAWDCDRNLSRHYFQMSYATQHKMILHELQRNDMSKPEQMFFAGLYAQGGGKAIEDFFALHHKEVDDDCF